MVFLQVYADEEQEREEQSRNIQNQNDWEGEGGLEFKTIYFLGNYLKNISHIVDYSFVPHLVDGYFKAHSLIFLDFSHFSFIDDTKNNLQTMNVNNQNVFIQDFFTIRSIFKLFKELGLPTTLKFV